MGNNVDVKIPEIFPTQQKLMEYFSGGFNIKSELLK